MIFARICDICDTGQKVWIVSQVCQHWFCCLFCILYGRHLWSNIYSWYICDAWVSTIYKSVLVTAFCIQLLYYMRGINITSEINCRIQNCLLKIIKALQKVLRNIAKQFVTYPVISLLSSAQWQPRSEEIKGFNDYLLNVPMNKLSYVMFLLHAT